MRIGQRCGSHEWHSITRSWDGTEAMAVPGGAIVRTPANRDGVTVGVGMVFVPDVVVAHRWIVEGEEARRETGLRTAGGPLDGWVLVDEELGDPPATTP